jgi:hypothetical protein
MKHNEVLYHRLSDLSYYMPFDYKDVNNAKTQDEVINLTIDWIEAYTYYLHVYIDSCEDSNPFDIEMDRYTRKLHVNRVKLCGVQNELIELLKTNNRSRFKTFMLIKKTVSLITKSAFTIYATDLFEDN